jgi:transposase
MTDVRHVTVQKGEHAMKTVCYLGIDVSHKRLDVAVQTAQGLNDLGRFTNDAAGYAQLRQAVLSHCGAGPSLHLIIEPTGSYHLSLLGFAYDQGWLVSLPNPQVVREWVRGQGQRAKTDRIDARLLALYGAKETPPPQAALPAAVEELDELLHRRDDLEKMLQQERNRRHSLQNRPRPSEPVMRSIEELIRTLEEALAEVEQTIQEHVKRTTTLRQQRQHLLQVPGIGEKSVLPILVFLYRWQARTVGLGTAKGLTAFAGLDPVTHNSGTSIHKRPSISKMGNGEIRRRLFLCALGGSRAKDTPLAHFYRRLLHRRKPPMVALIAAARKILVWAFAVFQSGRPFDPALASSKVH